MWRFKRSLFSFLYRGQFDRSVVSSVGHKWTGQFWCKGWFFDGLYCQCKSWTRLLWASGKRSAGQKAKTNHAVRAMGSYFGKELPSDVSSIAMRGVDLNFSRAELGMYLSCTQIYSLSILVGVRNNCTSLLVHVRDWVYTLRNCYHLVDCGIRSVCFNRHTWISQQRDKAQLRYFKYLRVHCTQDSYL